MNPEQFLYYIRSVYSSYDQSVILDAAQAPEMIREVLLAMGTESLTILVDGPESLFSDIQDGMLGVIRPVLYVYGQALLDAYTFIIRLGMYTDSPDPRNPEPYCLLILIQSGIPFGDLYQLSPVPGTSDGPWIEYTESPLNNTTVVELAYLYTEKEDFVFERYFSVAAILDLDQSFYPFQGRKGFRGFAFDIWNRERICFSMQAGPWKIRFPEASADFITIFHAFGNSVRTDSYFLILENGLVNDLEFPDGTDTGTHTIGWISMGYLIAYDDAFFCLKKNLPESSGRIFQDFYYDGRAFDDFMQGPIDFTLYMLNGFLGFDEDHIQNAVFSDAGQLKFEIPLSENPFYCENIHYTFELFKSSDDQEEYRFLDADFSGYTEGGSSLIWEGMIPVRLGYTGMIPQEEDLPAYGTFLFFDLGTEYMEAFSGAFDFVPDSYLADDAIHIMEVDPVSAGFYLSLSAPPSEEEPDEMDFYDVADEFSDIPLYAGEDGVRGSGIRVEELTIRGNLREKTLYVSVMADVHAFMSFSIGNFQIVVKNICGYLNYNPHNTGLGLSGTLMLGFSTTYELLLSAVYEKNQTQKLWTFEARLINGVIPLTELISQVTGWDISGVFLDIYRLDLRFCTDLTYFLALGIRQEYEILDGRLNIEVEGELSKSDPDGEPSFMLRGSVEIQSFLFEAQIRFDSSGAQTLRLLLGFDQARLTGTYADDVISVEIRNLTIGILLKLLFKVWRPNVKFYLSKPWDILNSVGFSKITLDFNVRTKDVSVYIAVGLDLLLVRIHGVRFTYQKESAQAQAKFMVDLDHQWLFETMPGQDPDAAYALADDLLQPWDALNDSSPAPFNREAEKLFRLNYFGIGRCIDLQLEETGDGKLSDILAQARKHVTPSQTLPAHRFDAAYGWFTGAQFTLLESFDVSLLFYDPLLYGVEVVVTDNEPLPLKGLELTIYYRKVTEKTGVFYVRAVLPDFIRHMDFGTLSFDLPDLEVWIYTNGNFKVNFGFPYERDFSRSFAISYGIFGGKGGFYFGYLNGDTSSQVPQTAAGYFDPVIGLGLGIQITIGKGFHAGILSLEAKLEMTGIFTGVFARFHYGLTGPQEQTLWYYKCSGYVCIAGEVSGSIDFFIISVSFRISASVSICLTLEDGEESPAVFEASFRVSAKITILFIKFSFAFSFTYVAEFVLGKKEDRPWKAHGLERQSRRIRISADRRARLEPYQAQAVFIPYFSIENRSVIWDGQQTGPPEKGQKKIAFFLSMEPDAFAFFYTLLAGRAIGFVEREETADITAEELDALMTALDDGTLAQAFSLQALHDFLDGVFSLSLSAWADLDAADTENGMSGVPLPLPPVYTIQWETLPQPPVPAGQEMQPPVSGAGQEPQLESIRSTAHTQEDLDTWFCEYLLMVTKLCISRIQQYVKAQEAEPSAAFPVSRLLEYVQHQAQADICAMVTRSMFGGTRTKDDRPLYEMLFQQFDGQEPVEAQADFVVHRLTLQKTKDVRWTATDTLTLEILNSQLVYPKEPLSVTFIQKPVLAECYRMTDHAVAFGDCQTVYLGDTPSYELWKPQGDISMLETLDIEYWEPGRLQQGLSARGAASCPCVALLELTVQRTAQDSGIYGILHAPEETRRMLSLLTQDNQYNKEEIGSVDVLWSKRAAASGEQKKKGAYFYHGNEASGLYLIRQNLSEVTKAPVSERGSAEESDGYVENLLDNPYGFFRLLHRMLETGTEGHYLKITEEPDPMLLNDEGGLTVTFAVFVRHTALANRVCLNPRAADGRIPVAVSPALGQKPLQTVPAGYTGFSFQIEGSTQDAEPFHLLYIRLYGEWLQPVSMQEPVSADAGCRDTEPCGGLYYSQIIKLPPAENPNPYFRIIPPDYSSGRTYQPYEVQMDFCFADPAGNRTSLQQMYHPQGLKLLYYDELHALTEIPCSACSYTLSELQSGWFCLDVQIVVQDRELRQDTDTDASLLQSVIYQLEMADVFLEASFYIGTYEWNAPYSQSVKKTLLSFLQQLLLYLKGSTKAKPQAFHMRLDLDAAVMEPSDKEIRILPLKTIVTIQRDAQFTDQSSPLPHICSISSELPPPQDYQAFASVFENIFPNARLAHKDGLYGVFFPKKALQMTPLPPSELFYSLRPLETRLMTREGVQIHTLSGGTVSVDFYETDLEQWAAEFFHFYEQLLLPHNLDLLLSGSGAGAGQHAGAGVIRGLLALKEQFCTTILTRLESLFTENEKNDAAQEALLDALRRNLSAGYQAAGAAVYQVRHRLSGYALDGGWKGISGIRSTKITAADKIGFVTDPVCAGAQKELSMMESAYTFTHIEDVRQQEWYRFVSSFEQLPGYIQAETGWYADHTPVKIPVPHRQYPVIPVLNSQRAHADHILREVPVWNYTFELTAALMAQDLLLLLVHRNDTGQSVRQRSDSGDLMDALAAFIYNKNAYQSALAGTDGAARIQALEHFLDVAQKIRAVWSPPEDRSSRNGEWEITPEFAHGYLSRLYIAGVQPLFQKNFPQLELEDESGSHGAAAYDAPNRCYHIPDHVHIAPGAPARYTFTCPDIPLYECQNLRTRLYIRKNARFLGIDANPHFIYTTPETGFDVSVWPLIRMQDPQTQRWEKEAAKRLLSAFLSQAASACGIRTELTASIGQRLQNGILAVKPFKKFVPHNLTEETVQQFLDTLDAELSRRVPARGQGYLVMISVRQYALRFVTGEGDGEEKEEYVRLLELEAKGYEY